VETYVDPKGPLHCKRCQRFGHKQVNCGYAPRCVACEGSHLSSDCSTPRKQLQCCGCGGKPHGEPPGLCEVQRSEGRSCKAGARSWPKERIHRPPCHSERTAVRVLCRVDEFERGVDSRRLRKRVVNANIPLRSIQNHPPQPVAEAFVMFVHIRIKFSESRH